VAFVENFAPFFADFGVDGTLAGTPVRGILDTATDVYEGELLTQRPTFLLAPGAAPAVGQSLVLAAATYTVRQVLAEPPDGALSRLVLVKV
jgi:hypothetical protein